MLEALLDIELDTTTNRWVITLIGVILFMFLVARRNSIRKSTAKKNQPRSRTTLSSIGAPIPAARLWCSPGWKRPR